MTASSNGGSANSMLLAQQAKKQRMMYATSSVGAASATAGGKSSCGESPSRKATQNQFAATSGGQVNRVSVTQKSPNKTASASGFVGVSKHGRNTQSTAAMTMVGSGVLK